MPSGTSPTWPLRESNLLHQAHEVIEEPLLRDLPLLIPCGHRTELHAETLPGRRDVLPIPGLHRSLHRAGEFRDGARVVSFRKEDLVRAVDEVVVREGLEEFSGFHVMVVPSPRGWGPAGPVHGDILSVTLPKSLPKRTSRSGIPSIVERRHQVDQLFLFHRRPLPPHRRVLSRNLAIPCHGLTHPSATNELPLLSPRTRHGSDRGPGFDHNPGRVRAAPGSGGPASPISVITSMQTMTSMGSKTREYTTLP